MKKIKNITFDGIRYILREFFLIGIYSIILFISAGKIKWINAWVFVFMSISFNIILITVIIINNPLLLNERGKIVRKGTKHYDLIFVILYVLFSFTVPVIAGFDSVRFKWTAVPYYFIYIGLGIFIVSSFIGVWAMSVNPFFSSTNRIQEENNHRVISAGPYNFIRHPGYLSWILSSTSFPLILGSLLSFIPIIILIIIFIIRTHLEDITLQKELHGYREYSRKVKYRLLPFIW